jgi:hypothetical protein
MVRHKHWLLCASNSQEEDRLMLKGSDIQGGHLILKYKFVCPPRRQDCLGM